MRVAFVGKGGAGKSTIAGTVARLLARSGEKVLALDVDTMPGLALSIGLGSAPDAGLPEELAERREGEGWVLREPVAAHELVDRYALPGPCERIRFLQLGKLPGRVRPGSSTAFRHVVECFDRPDWSIIGDLAAGTRQAFFGWAGFARLVCVVVEPTSASTLSARRLLRLRAAMPTASFGLVWSKVRTESVAAPAATGLDAPTWGTVRFDRAIVEAERAGKALVDARPESEAVGAIAGLLSRLHEESHA